EVFGLAEVGPVTHDSHVNQRLALVVMPAIRSSGVRPVEHGAAAPPGHQLYGAAARAFKRRVTQPHEIVMDGLATIDIGLLDQHDAYALLVAQPRDLPARVGEVRLVEGQGADR